MLMLKTRERNAFLRAVTHDIMNILTCAHLYTVMGAVDKVEHNELGIGT